MAAPLEGAVPLVVSVDASGSSDPDGSIASYRWNAVGGPSASGPTTSLRFDNAGAYWLTLLVTDSSGAASHQFWQVVVKAPASVIQTTAKVAASCGSVGAIRSDGRLLSSGLRERPCATPGRTGPRATPGPRQAPGLVDSISRVVSLAFGFSVGHAVLDDGSVFGWGLNQLGEIGDGTTSARMTPVRISGVSNVAAVASGFGHSLATTQDRRVFAWGSNSRGQLGTGALNDSLAPVAVPGLSGVRAVAAGDNFSLALKSDGTVWAWGENDVGQLGDGTSTNRSSPVAGERPFRHPEDLVRRQELPRAIRGRVGVGLGGKLRRRVRAAADLIALRPLSDTRPFRIHRLPPSAMALQRESTHRARCGLGE